MTDLTCRLAPFVEIVKSIMSIGNGMRQKRFTGNIIYIIREEPLSLLRKGSRSTRLWESPPIPIERYEHRPCLCVFVARFDRRIVLLFIKNGFVGAFAEGNSAR